jgi:tRNA(Ile)-lysidine synthase
VPNTFLDKVENAVAEHQLIPRGARVLLAVSGGLDSVVLLHTLHALSKRHGWQLAIAHFNHRLRGRESDEDERFVNRAARQLGLKFRAGRADVRLVSAKQGQSVEMAARQLRHQFLARSAQALGCQRIALAHHADDQVELFFLRLLRGAGPEGLTGMRWHGPSPVDRKRHLIRPLLGCLRRELKAFAAEQGLEYREDSTNQELGYPRNRIRHQLLPLLRAEYQPGLDRVILRLLDLLGSEVELVGEAANRARRSGVPFEQLPVSLQRRRLRDACLNLGISPEFELVEHLRLHPGVKTSVSPGFDVCRDAKGQVRRKPIRSALDVPEAIWVDLAERRGEANFSGSQFGWQRKPWRRDAKLLKSQAASLERFDADKVGRRIGLRHWQPGDRFQPIGLRAPVKLQDLFTNLKIPREQRAELVLGTTAASEIFWVEGLRISERFKVSPETENCLEWRWKRVAQPRALGLTALPK